jgi:signal transduction histidine kinase
MSPDSKEYQNFQSDEFLHSICHELRNPLNAITAFTSLIKDSLRNPSEILQCEEYVDEIDKAATDLNEIIGDLLDFRTTSLGNFSLDLSKEIDAKDAILRSIKLNKDYAIRRGITINKKIEENLNLIKLDPKRLRQILTNLISNAIKYSPRNTEIIIEAKTFTTGGGALRGSAFADKFLEINVIDQGFGMTADQVAQAFEKYTTFENPNSGEVDATGLGLAITKHLVELQKGEIKLESEPNKGTKAKLRFPY